MHCNDSVETEFDHLINIKLADGDIIDVGHFHRQAGINVRPGLQRFLKQVSHYYEIVIFTASQAYYANEVLNLIDPSNEIITYRLFNDHCFKTAGGHFIKDLRIIKNRNLANMVIVDNAAYSYAMQVENGVPIVPYFGGKQDNELADLAAYLIDLSSSPDVRPVIQRDFHIDLFKAHFLDPKSLLEKIKVLRRQRIG